MDNDTAAATPTVAEAGSRAVRQAAAPRRGGLLAVLIALLALLVAAGALWRTLTLERSGPEAIAALGDRLDQSARGTEQLRRDLDALRARLTDADTVNKGVREELLSLGERSRRLEDAVANLAEQHLTGRDALAANEAEYLLQLAGERLTLFHDADAALAAYRLADSALAATEDPVFGGVRQTIAAEMQALTVTKPATAQATLDALEKIRAGLGALPVRSEKLVPASAEIVSSSRLARLFAEFVQVHHDTAPAPTGRDSELARLLAGIDLRSAEAAVLARDQSAYVAALARARGDVAATFAADAAPVKTTFAALDKLAATPLAPALPELGSALRELRNLRATRALAQPPAPPKSAAGAAK